MAKETPMMKQYNEIKAKNEDAILMFRLGDFYEMFGEDAKVASRVLGIVLTARDGGESGKIPMCGVPHHAVDSYIATLVQNGYKVAMADQMEDPKSVKGIVKREVVKVISAGTFMDTIDPKENNFMVSLAFDKDFVALAYCDISTGELKATKSKNLASIIEEMDRISPSECLIPDDEKLSQIESTINERMHISLSKRPIFDYEVKTAKKALLEQFNVVSLEGFGIGDDDITIVKATGALLLYLHETQMKSLSHIDNMSVYSTEDFLIMDSSTRRNLELLDTTATRLKPNAAHNTLRSILDFTLTATGGRLLKQTLEMPSIKKEEIDQRQDFTAELLKNSISRMELRNCMKDMADLERISGKLGNQSIGPKELLVLAKTLRTVNELKELMAKLCCVLATNLREELDGVPEVVTLIEAAIDEDAKALFDSGGIIKSGYNTDVDILREALKDGKKWLLEVENKEKQETGIKSMKMGFNHVFGYYLEVTHANANLVPDRYIRKQTLANAERYITPELKEIEEKVLGAEEKVIKLEKDIYFSIRDEVANYTQRILKTAKAIAAIDVIAGFAEAAFTHKYVRPEISEEPETILKDARHPVLQERLTRLRVVPNDVTLTKDDTRLIVLTGPNMAGKSTVLSMVGMITVMAQSGSFVPASYAKIGITDRIFYRTGSYDDISSGKSTFMVELIEVASIINTATDRSLILVDELGRGTSTYDGMALAWAIAEWIHDKIGARTIFTTHYHELASLEGSLAYARNYFVGAKEIDGELLFLYKLIRGSADKSYGINVARMAGLPKKILKRSQELLSGFEEAFSSKESQMTLFGWTQEDSGIEHESKDTNDVNDKIRNMIEDIDLDDTTPRQALEVLSQLKSLLDGEEV